jgi:succinate dehydrogenase / fumarate reductase flavoprotein subunit
MERYDPQRMELSTRDIVARAIYGEVAEGRGTPRGGVYLDVSHLPAETVKSRLPSMYAQFQELAAIDITREPMEVGPTCHYIMGGIRVEAETGASGVEGLFAAGECAGGLSGATRLGGNSLSDLLVFGRRAGAAAAGYAATAAPGEVDGSDVRAAADELESFFAGDGDEDPYELHAELRRLMQRRVGIYRDEAGLNAALTAIEELKRRFRSVRVREAERRFNPGWHLCLDLRNMLVCAESIARAALLRTESRGAHSRLDFPEPSDDWGSRSVVAASGPAGMAVGTVPVVTVEELEPLVDKRRAQERR